MQKSIWFVFLFLTVVTAGLAQAQDKNRVGISIERDHLRNFRIDNRTFEESRTYTFRVSFYENKYTNIEYSLHHTRGYDESVGYSFGFSAGYMIPIADNVVLKPGLSFDAFKLKDRKCNSFVESVMRTVFDMDDAKCDDDQHTSFTPQLIAEIRISDPLSIIFRTDYRLMYSVIDYGDDGAKNNPDGNQSAVGTRGTDHSFFGAGIGFGAGIRYNF